MKHIAATAVCIVLIAFYTVFSYIFIGRFYDNMTYELINLCNSDYSENCINEIRTLFEDNKKILLVIVNKEYINSVEENIIRMECAAHYDNIQDIAVCEKLIQSSIDEIKKSSHTLY